MTIGVLQIEISVTDAMSLKDKRRVVKSIKDRIAHAHNVSIADIYVTIMGTEGQKTAALNALRHSAGLMRTRLTHEMTLRTAPFLKFHMDQDLKKELELLDMLRKVSEENAELDRRRAEQAGAEPQLPNNE